MKLRASGAPARERTPIGRKRLIIMIASVWLLTICSGSIFLIVVALKPVAAEFGWPRAVPSFAFSMQFIGAGVGGLVMGMLLDRLGFGVPAFVAAFSIGAGALLISSIGPGNPVSGVVSPEYQLYLVYGVMFGLFGQGCVIAPGLANIARFFSRRRGMAVGIVSSGQSLAGILWPPIFGAVMAEHGWREMFYWYGIFAFCTLIPAAWLVRPQPDKPAAPPSSADAPPTAEAATPFKPPKVLAPPPPAAVQWILCAAITGCCVAMALPLAHMVAFVTDHGFSVVHGTQILALMLVASFCSRVVVVGLLADNLGGLTALLAFSTVQAVMLATLTVTSSLWSIYLVAILFGIGYGGIFPVYTVIIREHIPVRQVGRRTGMVFLFGASAMGLGSWLGGYLYDLTGGYETPFLIGVAFNIVNLVIVAGLISRTGGFGKPKYAPG